MHPDEPVVELPIGPRGRRARRRRRARRLLRVVAVLAVVGPALVLLAGRRPTPVDAEGPQALHTQAGLTLSSPAPSTTVEEIRSLRAVAPATTVPGATTTTAAPVGQERSSAPTTTTAPASEGAAPTGSAAAEVPPASAAAPAEAPAPTAPPTTAPPTTAAPTTAPPTTAPPTTAPPTTAAPAKPAGGSQRGQATWYRWKAGNCAHNSLPKGTVVTVTNLANGKSTFCVVGDRGAFRSPTIIDLDASVFAQIAPLGAGRINVAISW